MHVYRVSGSMVFHDGFQMWEGVKGYSYDSWVFQFMSHAFPLLIVENCPTKKPVDC